MTFSTYLQQPPVENNSSSRERNVEPAVNQKLLPLSVQ